MRRILSIYCLLMIFVVVHGQDSQVSSPQDAVKVRDQRQIDARTGADVLFNPVFKITDDSGQEIDTPNAYPTASLNETAVSDFYTALGVDATVIRYIKNFYFYLEYVTKLDQAARLAALSHQKNIDFYTIIDEKGWGGIVSELGAVYGSADALWKTVQNTNPIWEDIHGTVVAESWQKMLETSFWKDIAVTHDDIQRSLGWQTYLKFFITYSFEKDGNLLTNIKSIEEQIFKYIPNIEIAFYHPDFTRLRNSAELYRTSLVLTDEQRSRAVSDCIEWQSLTSQDVYKASQEFMQTPLYKLTKHADENVAEILALGIDFKPSVTVSDFTKEVIPQERLMIIAMIKSLQSLLEDRFSSNNLEPSMEVLHQKTTLPQPNILLYVPDDFLYLEDRASILSQFEVAAQQEQSAQSTLVQSMKINPVNNTQQRLLAHNKSTPQDRVIVQSFWGDVWHGVKQGAKDLGKALSDAEEGIKDAGKSIIEGAESLGLFIAGTFQGPKGKDLLEKSKKLKDKAFDDFEHAIKDAQNVTNDLETAAKDTTHVLGIVANKVISQVDPQLGTDVEKFFDAAADYAIDFAAQTVKRIVTSFGTVANVVRLTTEAVYDVANIISDAIVYAGNWKDMGEAMLGDIKSFASDLATAILDTASFVISSFVEQFKDLIKMTACLVSTITDIIIDASKIVASAFAFIFTFDVETAKDVWQKTNDALDAHRRTIDTAVTISLMIGVEVLTGGLSTPAVVMIVGPMLFNLYGSYQKDEDMALRKKEQHEFVQNYQTFVTNNKDVVTRQQQVWSQELNGKYEAEITNQERQLGFYQNFLNNYFKQIEDHQATLLGEFMRTLLTTDYYDKVPVADIGSLYGVSTDVYTFNPSQGFAVYNYARDSYSQEIASSPAVVAGEEPSDQFSKTMPEKFWFMQRQTLPLVQEAQEVEIRFKVLYILNAFHVGVYFGGAPYDIETIKKTGNISIDLERGAKMLVLKKEATNEQISLGLYEHEGQGWFTEQAMALSEAFERGVWYRMNMKINGNQITVQTWQEGKTGTSYTFTAQLQTAQQTLGVISSGASIEYQIIKPEGYQINQENTRVKLYNELRDPDLKNDTEKKREQLEKARLQKKLTPSIGTVNLQSLGKVPVLKGQYLYQTKDTDLTISNTVVNDYIVLGKRSDTDMVSGSIGVGPQDLPVYLPGQKETEQAALISLISEKVFDDKAQAVKDKDNRQVTIPGIFSAYVSKMATEEVPLSDELVTTLSTQHTQYVQRLLGPFAFGTINLISIGLEELTKGIFVYQATSPAAELLDASDKPRKDDAGNDMYDYFVMFYPDSFEQGMEYSGEVPGILSLVTGLVYTRESVNPINADEPYTGYFEAYQDKMNKSIADTIQTSINFYTQQVDEEKKKIDSGKIADDTDISKPDTHTGSDTDTVDTGTAIPDESMKDKTDESGGGWFG